MKHKSNFIMNTIIFVTLMYFFNSCKDPVGIVEPNQNTSNEARAFMKLAEQSPSINSFIPNYNEEEAMSLSNSLGKEFQPIKIGQKVKVTERKLTIEKDSVTAIGTLIQKFEGILIIVGSFQKETMGIQSRIDTVIEKPFNTIMTRKIKFDRINNTGNDTVDWKITGISLPIGGTEGEDISIQRMILTAQDGSEFVIDNPNNFFFDVGRDKNYGFEEDKENLVSFGFGVGNTVRYWKKLFTWYRKNQNVKLKVEILSSSEDPELLTITYGASMNGKFRTKEKFEMVSIIQEGNYYRKIYERKFKTNSNAGRKHIVINALPRNSVYDSESPVIEKTWGIPYKVH